VTDDGLLKRLQDPSPGAALDELAELIVDHQLSRPLTASLDPQRITELLRATLRGWCESDEAEEQLVSALRDELNKLKDEKRPLGELVSDSFQEELEKLASEPYALDRDLLLALIDRGPFRALIRELLVETLQNFAQRMSTPVADSRVAKKVLGIGQRARNRALSHAGSLGSLADAVSEGVERQLDKRVSSFADSALSTIMQRIADYLCSPDRLADQEALRKGLLEGVWELQVAQLAGELDRSNLEATASMLRSGVGTWVERADFQEVTSQWIEERLDAIGDRSVRDLLNEFSLEEPLRGYALEHTRANLGDLVESEAFTAWFLKLCGTGT